MCSKILEQLLVKNDEIANAQKLRKVISVILGQDIDEIKKYHSECPIPYEITKKAKEMKNIELNIFILGNLSPYIQQSINNFISSREPYSIKIFVNGQYQHFMIS